MKLTNTNNLLIPKEKLIDYVLSKTHAIGKFKAKFFRSLGFDETNVSIFEKALSKIARSQEIVDVQSSSYGTKYIIDGEIKTPREKLVKVRTVWIVEKGQTKPRFITVYPV